jgi:hypothetical protein
MSQAAIGRNGRKNWRVIGRTREKSNSDATEVFTSAPGDSIMHIENMPRIASMRYCPRHKPSSDVTGVIVAYRQGRRRFVG